jgi:hypothetical protein
MTSKQAKERTLGVEQIEAALIRAARNALLEARRTRTPFIVYKNGKMIDRARRQSKSGQEGRQKR